MSRALPQSALLPPRYVEYSALLPRALSFVTKTSVSELRIEAEVTSRVFRFVDDVVIQVRYVNWDLIAQMIVTSDNTATDVMIERLGRDPDFLEVIHRARSPIRAGGPRPPPFSAGGCP